MVGHVGRNAFHFAKAECSQVTCPAGYVQNPSRSITCCVRSSTLTSSTTASTRTTSWKVSTSSTKPSNQYHQTKIHNKIINQHIISDDRISQRKRGRSSTGSIGIASVPRLSFKSTWMPRGIVGMMLLAFATRMMFFFSNWQSTCHSLQSFLFEGPERYRKMFSTEQPWQLPNLRSQEVASWHDACSCNYL